MYNNDVSFVILDLLLLQFEEQSPLCKYVITNRVTHLGDCLRILNCLSGGADNFMLVEGMCEFPPALHGEVVDGHHALWESTAVICSYINCTGFLSTVFGRNCLM